MVFYIWIQQFDKFISFKLQQLEGMQCGRSSKGQKLMELRNKLAKLNGHPILGEENQKIGEINQQNQIIEAEIFSVVDSICQYCYKSEQKIKSISKQIIQKVKQTEAELLRWVQILKTKQLEALKCYTTKNLHFKNKANKLTPNLSQLNYHEKHQIKPIHKLQLLRTGVLKQKIIEYQQEIDEVNHKIEAFAGFIGKIGGEGAWQSTYGNNSKQEEFVQTAQIQKNYEKIMMSNSNSRQYLQKPKKKLKLKSPSEKPDKFRNKVHQQKQYKISKNIKRSKLDDEDYLDEKTQKNICINNHKLARKKSLPAILGSFFKNNVEEFLGAMPNNRQYDNNKQRQREIGSDNQKLKEVKQKQIIAYNPESEISNLYRIKSEKNFCLQPFSLMPFTMEISRADSNIKNVENGSSSSLNHDGESKSSKRGNWLTILKEQQLKYNQFKKM